MNKKQLKRLKALVGKSADTITDAEKAELTALQALATTNKIDTKSIDTAIEAAADDDSDEMTEDEVQEVVTKAVKEALATHKSATSEDVAEHVTKALAEKSITEDKIRSIMGEVMKEQHKSASKMEYHTGETATREFPCEHRSGNLSVAQKQLLNICLGSVSQDALESMGTKRPSGINDGIPDSILRHTKSANDRVIANIKSAGAKALTTSGSGSGAELVYVDLATQLHQRLYLDSDLAQVLLQREIAMPTDPFRLPIKTVRTPFNQGAEASIPSTIEAYLGGGQPTLANITLDAKKMIGIASYSYESNEDSVIAVLPMIQDDMADGAVAAFESACLNGDTDGTHMDTVPDHSATAVERMYDGLRKAGIAVGVRDWSTGGVSKSNFMALRAAMGKYGVNPKDLAIIVSPYGYIQLQAIEEAFRADARGGNNLATVGTGVLPSFNGIKVVVSEHMPETAAATGLLTAGGAKQSLILAHLPHWMVGARRGFTVEVVSDPRVQMNYVVASFRRALTQKEAASASIPHTVLATNWG